MKYYKNYNNNLKMMCMIYKSIKSIKLLWAVAIIKRIQTLDCENNICIWNIKQNVE